MAVAVRDFHFQSFSVYQLKNIMHCLRKCRALQQIYKSNKIKRNRPWSVSFVFLYFENKVRYQMALVTLPERKQRVQA
jgi:hypothetical protein